MKKFLLVLTGLAMSLTVNAQKEVKKTTTSPADTPPSPEVVPPQIVELVDEEEIEEEIEISPEFDEDDMDGDVIVEESSPKEEAFLIAEKSAAYKDGQAALYRTINGYLLKHRPENLRLEGTVFVSFVVEKNGELSEYKVIKGLSEEANQLAIEAVKQTSGNWHPASQRKVIVRQIMRIPIYFKTE